MIIYKSGEKIKRQCVVMLGAFDGLHLGHKRLIDTARSVASRMGLHSVLYTFTNNPKMENRALLTKDRKIELCEAMGVDAVYFQDFTDGFKRMEPENFIEYIKNVLNAAAVVVGFDYRFGYRHGGSISELKNCGFELYVVHEVKLSGRKVSSTAVREFLNGGEIEKANDMLGYAFALDGKVSDGRRVGRSIGFRTANICPAEGIVIPGNGVYSTMTTVDGKKYLSVTNIGTKPTFGLDYVTVETHILGFDGEIYGKNIRVEFFLRLRSEKAFASNEELSVQIKKDVENTKKLLGDKYVH